MLPVPVSVNVQHQSRDSYSPVQTVQIAQMKRWGQPARHLHPGPEAPQAEEGAPISKQPLVSVNTLRLFFHETEGNGAAASLQAWQHSAD
jgi:hypothetical protein